MLCLPCLVQRLIDRENFYHFYSFTSQKKRVEFSTRFFNCLIGVEGQESRVMSNERVE